MSKKEKPRYDRGPYVRRSHLIMGALTDGQRKVSPIRTEPTKIRPTICAFDTKNPNWEGNLERVLSLLNGSRQPQEEEKES